MKINLLETSDIKITYHNFNEYSDRLIISFGHISSDIEEKGFGTDLSRSLGVNNIYVSQRVGTQYQSLSLNQFYDTVCSYVVDKKSYAYGSSLGGYSALYFGGITNSKIISVSPINHAHPTISSPEFKDLKYSHIEMKDAPRATINPIVLFDPHQKDDVKFIDECVKPAYPDAAYISYPFAGHTILETMKENKVLSYFIRRLILDDVIENLNLKEEGCSIYHAQLGRKNRYENNFDNAELELKKSLKIKPNGIAYAHLLWVYILTSNLGALTGLIAEIIQANDRQKINDYIPVYMRNRIKEMGVDVDTIILKMKFK